MGRLSLCIAVLMTARNETPFTESVPFVSHALLCRSHDEARGPHGEIKHTSLQGPRHRVEGRRLSLLSHATNAAEFNGRAHNHQPGIEESEREEVLLPLRIFATRALETP